MIAPAAHPGHRVADVRYGAERLAAGRRDNVWGCQFYPEKSDEFRLGLLRTFLSL